MTEIRKTILLLFGILIAALVGCVVGCLVATGLSGTPHGHSGPDDGHIWLHEELGVTQEQKKALAPIEDKFAARKGPLREAILRGNAELGQTLREDRDFSPRAVEAIERIHHAQAELQKATVEHVIEMKTVLTPEQFDFLLELAGEAMEDH